jgi:hypothetical protein
MSLPVFFGLSAALHLYIALRIVPWLPGPWAAGPFALLLVLSFLFVPLGMLSRRWMKPPVADTIAAIGLTFMGLFSSMLVLTFLREAVLLLARGAALFWPQALDFGAWQAGTAAVVPPLALLITALGLWNARRTARVKTVDVQLKDLPGELHGFTIVQISDIHVGPTIRHRYVESIVEAVNRLKPDVVAITGDLVDGTVAELGGHVEPLSRLLSRHGSFFVTGNHEYYAGALPWMAELTRLGIRVLHNEHVVIHREGAKLVLAGVTDFGAGHFHDVHRSDPHAAIAGAPRDAGA